MALDEIPECTGLFIEYGPSLDTNTFGRTDNNAADALVVPDPFKNRVAESKGEDVLGCFLRKVMVDTVDLFFRKVLIKLVNKLFSRGEVIAEGFLYKQTGVVCAVLA